MQIVAHPHPALRAVPLPQAGEGGVLLRSALNMIIDKLH